MLDLLKIVDQVEKLAAMGHSSTFGYGYYDVYLNEPDFDEAWNQYQTLQLYATTPPTKDEFMFTAHNFRVYFYKKTPDYVDGSTYYYFDKKQSVYQGLLPTIDTEIRVLKEEDGCLKIFDPDGNEKNVYYYIKEEYLKFNDKSCGSVDSRCYHYKTKTVFMVNSAYEMCANCKEVIRDLSREEFLKALKGKNLRYL